MSMALILRDRTVQLSSAERAAANRALEHGLRGVDEKNHARWLRFLRRVFALEHGEVVEIGTRVPRSGPFHRFHMSIEQAVFDSQERFADFDQFRNWLKIGAGHVRWVPGARGGIVPLPMSTSYAELEEEAMRQVHDKMLAFLRTPHCTKYLWKQLAPAAAESAMDAILMEFRT